MSEPGDPPGLISPEYGREYRRLTCSRGAGWAQRAPPPANAEEMEYILKMYLIVKRRDEVRCGEYRMKWLMLVA
jgi:hypothetical protein